MALNRIITRPDLPLTLQGGEPTLHPQFYEIIHGIKPDINIDLLTNCQFNVRQFMERIPPSRLKRDAKYASIRVSYHPKTMELADTIERVSTLKNNGYSVGVWIVDYPKDPLIKYYVRAFQKAGIDCRLKEYLDGKDYGTYKYRELQGRRDMACLPSEFLIAPNGDIHRCHGDLYGNRKSYGNILDNVVTPITQFTPCKKVACNSCDVKVKYDRFQVMGHCAVEIKEIKNG
jgi:hypothetical protein